jgi:hypothetical protein
MENLDKAINSLKTELKNDKIPDFTSHIQRNLISRKSAKVISIRRYLIAAALLITFLNVSAVWYVWSNQSSFESVTAIEELYANESNWNTFLTQVD